MSDVKCVIGIPTINRADLLEEALDVYSKNWKRDIFIIDNGNQKISLRSNVKVMKQTSNLGVAGSWNLLCKTLFNFGYTHVCLLNDDVIWNKTQEEVDQFIKDNPTDFYVGTGTWCNIILPKTTWNKVGEFDTMFYPAYFEDNDYCYRMRLKGLERINSEFFNPEVYRNSQTIARDKSLNQNFDANKELFKEKWGGYPLEETYKIPYNI